MDQKTAMTRLMDYLNSRSSGTLILLGSAAVLFIGLADYVTGYELSLFIFYLVPVSVVASFGGVRPGVAISLAGALAWLLTDLLESRRYTHEFIP